MIVFWVSKPCFAFSAARAMPSANNNLTAEQTVARYIETLEELYRQRHTLDETEVDRRLKAFIKDVLDLDRFVRQILQQEWQKLGAYEQSEFKQALIASIKRKFANIILQNSDGAIPTLTLESKEEKERFVELNYSFQGRGARRLFTLYMIKHPDGIWRVSNIRDKEQTMLRYYYEYCSNLIDGYSFNYLLGELLDQGFVILEDFESSEVGKLPEGWTWKDKDDDKHKPYTVVQDEGNKFLAARDTGQSVILGKDVQWNLNEYPYVSFRWRAHHLPEGGDERYGRTVDSAAGIYFIYRKKLVWIPESVKYVWSTTLPVGAAMQRSGVGRPWMVVAESGRENLGEWHTYVFNLYEAYKKTFGGDPPDKPIGIGILSDANSTNSKAYADYDDIRALKNADADSGIQKYMDAE